MDDQSTTISELKAKVQRFCEEREWDQFHNPKDLAMGISTEASELLQIFRFKREDEIREIMADTARRRDIGEELADVLYFLLMFAQMNGFDHSYELEKKLEKNSKGYPVEKAKGSNKKYNEK
jgi:NTP pyrophosphatase (non-canonical NTP hydrolase)